MIRGLGRSHAEDLESSTTGHVQTNRIAFYMELIGQIQILCR